MKDIAIYGAGGFGKEVACLIEKINRTSETQIWNFIGFFDDGKEKGIRISHYGDVLGGMNELNAYNSPLNIVLSIGNPQVLKKLRAQIVNKNIYFPNIIDPSFIIGDSESFKIGCGNIIQNDCGVSCDVEIGDFNVLNGSVSIGHDAKIGNFNVIMPNIRISGEVIIGNCNMLGVGSIVLQQITIGNDVHLGAGAVLMTKPKNGSTYIGNPAKIFKFK